MADIVEPAVRSKMMSLIRGRDTRPERLVRSGLWAQGFRFRLHAKSLPGRPDLLLPRWRTAIFVNGCFWHAHANCPYFRLPTSRREFWEAKLLSNRQRDATSIAQLVEDGWKVITVWECALRSDAAKTVLLAGELIRDATRPCWEIRQAPPDHDSYHVRPYLTQVEGIPNTCQVSGGATKVSRSTKNPFSSTRRPK